MDQLDSMDNQSLLKLIAELKEDISFLKESLDITHSELGKVDELIINTRDKIFNLWRDEEEGCTRDALYNLWSELDRGP